MERRSRMTPQQLTPPNPSQIGKPLKPKHELFAIGLAKGLKPAEAYVSAGYKRGGAGVSASRLWQNANIRARVAELRAGITAAVVADIIKTEIGSRDARVVAKSDRWKALQQIREARSKDPGILKAPGGHTGFVQVTVRTVRGPDGRMVPVMEHSVDTAMLREFSALEREVQEELGQRVDRSVTGITGVDESGNPAAGGEIRIVLSAAESESDPDTDDAS